MLKKEANNSKTLKQIDSRYNQKNIQSPKTNICLCKQTQSAACNKKPHQPARRPPFAQGGKLRQDNTGFEQDSVSHECVHPDRE